MKVKKIIATLLALMLVLALASCGDGASDKEDATEKTMIAALPAIASTFNFYQCNSGYEATCLYNVYDTLVERDGNNNLVPGLADSWETVEGDLGYTFHLRQDVYFSNGTKFTADDVAFSLEKHKASDDWGYIYQMYISDITIVDEYTITISTEKPCPTLLATLGEPTSCCISSKAAFEEFGDDYGTSPETIVGTGPYVVTGWKYGESISYAAKDDYWQGAPAIKNVTLKVISDIDAASVALQTGEINAYFDDIPGVSVETIKQSENVNLVEFPGWIFMNVYFNCQQGLFADATLRQAVAYAIDKNEFLSVGNEGYGTTIDYLYDLGGLVYANPDVSLNTYSKNIDKARNLVKASGYAGEPVKIYTYPTDPYPQLATLLQSSMSEIGINVSVQILERATLMDQCMYRGDFEVMLIRIGLASFEFDEVADCVTTDAMGSIGNYAWYSNPKVDKLMADARYSNSLEERKALYAQFLEIYDEEQPFITLYVPQGLRAVNGVTVQPDLARNDQLMYFKWVE